MDPGKDQQAPEQAESEHLEDQISAEFDRIEEESSDDTESGTEVESTPEVTETEVPETAEQAPVTEQQQFEYNEP